MSGISWEKNVDVQPYNTFNVPSTARWLVRVQNISNLYELVNSTQFHNKRSLILGGGSNILFANAQYDGIVLKNEIQGIKIQSEDDQHVTLRVGGGVEWVSLVDYCVQNDLGGIENLSLIPGTVGAAPVQNIGAYGAELSDVLVAVEVFDLDTGQARTMPKDECEPKYRGSIFKDTLKSVMICAVTIRVVKARFYSVNTGYGLIRDVLLELGISTPTIRSVSEAICLLRKRKIPDPKSIGNAGSFFKNVVCDDSIRRSIESVDANTPFYRNPDGTYVIPAAWLIEKCGWKGRQFDNVGVSSRHALVLVNLGRAEGREIVWLAELIMRDVQAQLGLLLTPEVNIIR
ncbi:hypothetical protein N7478_013064 [Penicillium angulare]|uniref:uncharacterized protein n=1 Tax=Penicillium angulare TaxID=116970 RepID=UPI0025418C64|nr:uncharacterized protein N7478_013064 [Penicillium angulare]KAJ5256960.1 hypothetical protein N7478_013064 [Penicillium angulare]